MTRTATIPPELGSQSAILFGSLSTVEGPIGRYGLKLSSNSWTTTGGKYSNEYRYSLSSTDSAHAPGGTYLSVTYPQLPDLTEDGTVKTSWSTSANIKLDTAAFSALSGDFMSVHLHWPTTLNVKLNGGWTHELQNPAGVGDVRDEYYSYIKFDNQLLDKKRHSLWCGLC